MHSRHWVVPHHPHVVPAHPLVGDFHLHSTFRRLIEEQDFVVAFFAILASVVYLVKVCSLIGLHRVEILHVPEIFFIFFVRAPIVPADHSEARLLVMFTYGVGHAHMVLILTRLLEELVPSHKVFLVLASGHHERPEVLTLDFLAISTVTLDNDVAVKVALIEVVHLYVFVFGLLDVNIMLPRVVEHPFPEVHGAGDVEFANAFELLHRLFPVEGVSVVFFSQE